MPMFEKAGYRGVELEGINRVRVHQQVPFLSDVLYAGGRYLDSKYLKLRPLNETWSELRFPNEDPTVGDLKL